MSTTPSGSRSHRGAAAVAPPVVGHRPVRLAVTALLLTTVTGCSVRGYDVGYGLATQSYRENALLKNGLVDLADRRLVMRLPKVTTEEGDIAQASWVTPPFMRDMPGIRTAYRGWVESAESKLPVTFTVGVLTDDEFDVEKVKQKISTAVREDATFGKASWENVVDARSKPDMQWSRLRLSGKQPFEITIAGNPEQKNIEGNTECWVAGHAENKVVVLFVWRAPAEVMEGIKFDLLPQVVARWVMTNPGRDPPAEPVPAAAEPGPAAAK